MDSTRLTEKLKEIFARFGLLNKIIFDNGSRFYSTEFIHFCKIQKELRDSKEWKDHQIIWIHKTYYVSNLWNVLYLKFNISVLYLYNIIGNVILKCMVLYVELSDVQFS